MEKIKKVIIEVHLYENKIEALIKILIWIISWIGGILTLLGTEEKRVLGSAYFIYTLSLLMEFVQKIDNKTLFLSKLLHTVFCLLMSIVCMLSIGVLFGLSLPDGYFTLMFILTVVVIAYMIVDLFLLWVISEKKIKDNKINDINMDSNALLERFNDKLSKGDLGDIENINQGVVK